MVNNRRTNRYGGVFVLGKPVVVVAAAATGGRRLRNGGRGYLGSDRSPVVEGGWSEWTVRWATDGTAGGREGMRRWGGGTGAVSRRWGRESGAQAALGAAVKAPGAQCPSRRRARPGQPKLLLPCLSRPLAPPLCPLAPPSAVVRGREWRQTRRSAPAPHHPIASAAPVGLPPTHPQTPATCRGSVHA